MTTSLPAGWTKTTLGQLGRYLNGRAFKKSEWATTGRPIVRIQNLTGTSRNFNYFAGELEDKYIARPGDLLVSWAATLGAFLWQGPEAAVNQHIFKVESHIDVRFHKYLIDHALEELAHHTHGSGIVHITRGRFDSVPVLLPPLDEQHRIVAVLEDHLSRLDAARVYVSSGQARTPALQESLLSREASRVPTVSLGEALAQPLANGRSVPDGDGAPVLRLTALRDGQVDLQAYKLGRWTAREAEPFGVRRGDVLVSRGNGSLSRVARGGLVGETSGPVAFPDTMVRIRLDVDRVDPWLFLAFWNSRSVRRQIEARVRTTAGIYKINQQQLLEVRVPIPPRDRQDLLVAALQDLVGARSRLALDLQQATIRGARLRSALLSAAYTGGL